MVNIKPFRALRPAPEKAKQVSCVPYDVAYESEVREFIRTNPESFLHVTRPEAEFPENESPSHDAVLSRAKHNLASLTNSGSMSGDDQPSFYIYRLTSKGHIQTGVVACCSLDEYDAGSIKKHEKTRPDKVRDRTGHMLSLRAQTGLIFLAFQGTAEIRRLIDETVAGQPLYDFVCTNDVRQTVWRVAETEPMRAAFADVPSLYIADGHHRIESASLARENLKKQNSGHTGSEDYNFVLAGIFPAEDLKILPYNRVLYDINGLDEATMFEKLRADFLVEQSDRKSPREHGSFCIYFDRKWYELRFAKEHSESSDPIDRLDVAILQKYILGPVFGVEDPRTSNRIGFVGGGRGVGELERLVNSGKAAIAFSLYPTTIDDLIAVSDAGEIMPPKSTWFEPKLKDGLFVHLI